MIVYTLIYIFYKNNFAKIVLIKNKDSVEETLKALFINSKSLFKKFPVALF